MATPNSEGGEAVVGMRPDERAALNASGDLWNMIVALGDHHPSDLQETCRDIHDIQNRLMARATSRALGNATWRGSQAIRKAEGGGV